MLTVWLTMQMYLGMMCKMLVCELIQETNRMFSPKHTLRDDTYGHLVNVV